MVFNHGKFLLQLLDTSILLNVSLLLIGDFLINRPNDTLVVLSQVCNLTLKHLYLM